MNKRKILYRGVITFSAAMVCLASNSFALDTRIKLGGQLEFQTMYYKNNGAPKQRVVSKNNKNFGFNSSGNMFLDYHLIDDNDIEYGTKVAVELTNANDRGVPFSVYVKTNLGKIEAGSDKSAGQKMKITGYAASCAVGNGWNHRVKSSPDSNLLGYVTSFCSFLDAKMRTFQKVEYSRKVTYFTPKIHLNESNNIKFGVSYIPDSSNMGYDVPYSEDVKHTPVHASKYAFVIKDGVSYGVTHEWQISEKSSIKTSFVGEKGTPIGVDKKTNKKSDIKFRKLNVFVVGSEITYNKCSFSGSYGNFNKSLTAREVDLLGKETYIYAIGGKYAFGKYAASLNYFASNHKKNKFNATTLGLDYKITTGVKSYIQATYYQASGKHLEETNLKFDKSKGTVIIAGAKISI